MNEERLTARSFADVLSYSGALSLALIAAVFLALPLIAGAAAGKLLLWPVFALAFFAALALSLHVSFDALLFRMISSYNDLDSGCRAIDAFLRRTGLKHQPQIPRSLADRIAGTRKVLRLQRAALLVFLALFVALASPYAGGPI